MVKGFDVFLMCVLLFVGAFVLGHGSAEPTTSTAPMTEPTAELPLPPLGHCLRADLPPGNNDRCVTFTSQCNRVCWGIGSAIAAVSWREEQRCVCAGPEGVDVFTVGFTEHERVMETGVLCVDPE